jgi:hypothetical protein
METGSVPVAVEESQECGFRFARRRGCPENSNSGHCDQTERAPEPADYVPHSVRLGVACKENVGSASRQSFIRSAGKRQWQSERDPVSRPSPHGGQPADRGGAERRLRASRQLGHASPDITLRVYAHLFDRAEHAQRASKCTGGPLWKNAGKRRWRDAASGCPRRHPNLAQLRQMRSAGN